MIQIRRKNPVVEIIHGAPILHFHEYFRIVNNVMNNVHKFSVNKRDRIRIREIRAIQVARYNSRIFVNISCIEMTLRHQTSGKIFSVLDEIDPYSSIRDKAMYMEHYPFVSI
jgi:hypothetical protein